jgi:glycosyltransferase involved in cell wall biosynthesis
MVGDGALRPAVEEEIRTTGAPIHLTGFLNQSAIPDAYGAADALVLASETETWGLVVNEAMACGLPAVVSDRVGCAADLVTDGETGFVYPCADVPALASRLARLASEPALVNRLSDAARKRVAVYSVKEAADGLCRAVVRASNRSIRC